MIGLSGLSKEPLLLGLNEVGMNDIPLVGGKGASLGEMTRAGFSVPPGFVVTTVAYEKFMKANRLDGVVAGLLAPVNVYDMRGLHRAAEQVQSIIGSTLLGCLLREAVEEAYEGMGGGPVAVRSSATAEDLPGASFAGQQNTFLYVEGVEDILDAIRACWASLFEARSIFYRASNGFNHEAVSIAVPVQRMVPSDVSGVLFTADPSSGNRNTLVIEAVYGLGEPLVSGQLTPDAYVVAKESLHILSREVASQKWQLRRDDTGQGFDHGTGPSPVPTHLQESQKLPDERILELARLGLHLEEHYNCPQDVEWALAQDQLYVVQSRPITTLDGQAQSILSADDARSSLLAGAAASPGVAAGPVRLIRDASRIDQLQPGEVLVTEMTTPDFVLAMKQAAAIITDRGSRTCHAAIVSREMGVPCVVGTGNGTTVLQGYGVVTVDGNTGKVFGGDLTADLRRVQPTTNVHQRVVTRTKLYVNLADPDAAERVAAMDVDGVGLLRAEFMMAHIGEHPRAMLTAGRGAEFTRRLADGLELFGGIFAPRPVVYRFSDFKTNEYRNLRGGEAYEPREENPMLGYRGCARYLAEPDLFALEVEAVKKARQRFSNLWVMLPFVRTVDELKGVKNLLTEHGLLGASGLKLWMMLEVPSNVLLLDAFLDAGVDGISIGSNDLTQLILGVDRDNERLASAFDERDPAVQQALEKVIREATGRGVNVSICGQAPSVYPELTRQLVSWGITSISVSPDAVERTRRIIAEAESGVALWST